MTQGLLNGIADLAAVHKCDARHGKAPARSGLLRTLGALSNAASCAVIRSMPGNRRTIPRRMRQLKFASAAPAPGKLDSVDRRHSGRATLGQLLAFIEVLLNFVRVTEVAADSGVHIGELARREGIDDLGRGAALAAMFDGEVEHDVAFADADGTSVVDAQDRGLIVDNGRRAPPSAIIAIRTYQALLSR